MVYASFWTSDSRGYLKPLVLWLQAFGISNFLDFSNFLVLSKCFHANSESKILGTCARLVPRPFLFLGLIQMTGLVLYHGFLQLRRAHDGSLLRFWFSKLNLRGTSEKILYLP